MAHLIDGHAGHVHISGDDTGALNAGIFGESGCVLSTAHKLKCTIENANLAIIDTGDLIMPKSGRHVRVTQPEQLSIANGSDGRKRHDLIVARYAIDDNGCESVSLIVIKGTSSAGDASDPAYKPEDLLLYRISLDGLTPTASALLCPSCAALTSLVAQVKNEVKTEYTAAINKAKTDVTNAIITRINNKLVPAYRIRLSAAVNDQDHYICYKAERDQLVYTDHTHVDEGLQCYLPTSKF